MKKWFAALLSLTFILLLTAPVAVFADVPEITLDPQNYNYTEGASAIYTVKATGENLTFTWYLEYKGVAYNLVESAGKSSPWEAYAGSDYGAYTKDGASTYHFNGIMAGLDGAKIYCQVDDGYNYMDSYKAHISVSGTAVPPMIEVPVFKCVYENEPLELECKVNDVDVKTCNFQWYQTSNGELENIKALLDATATNRKYKVDTGTAGTRMYCCGVTTNAGGRTYSSVITVTVLAMPELEIMTSALPDAVAGEAYSAKIECNTDADEISVYYNPGKKNEFEQTGLALSKDGTISGTPSKAGAYTFSVMATGSKNDAYAEITLVVNEPKETQTSSDVTEPSDTTAATAETTAGETLSETGTTAAETADTEATEAAASDTETTAGQTITTLLFDSSSSSVTPTASNFSPLAIVLIIALSVLVIVNIIVIIVLFNRKKQ